MTFEKVIADVGAAFASGQVYVALSRCTTFSGLVLKTRIDRQAIITDPKVLLFAQNETPSTLIVQELNSSKADYYYKKSRDAFKLFEFSKAYDNLIKAIKFRNDLETDIFERYIVASLTRIASSIKSSKSLSLILEDIKIDNENLLAINLELKAEIKEQEKKTNEQNRAIKLLLEKTKEFEKGKKHVEILLASQKTQTAALKAESVKLKKDLTNYKSVVEKNEDKISELEKNCEAQEQEINRLRLQKWYHKLLGKK